MAEEIIDIPEIPEIIDLGGGYKRRSSTGNLNNSTYGVKARYLSASMGSCHDLCKYGRKQIPEEKPWNSISKRVTARPGEVEDQARGVNIQDIKKIPVTNPKPLPDFRRQTTNQPRSIKKEAPASSKKGAVSPKTFLLSGNKKDASKKPASELRLKPVKTKPSSFTIPGNSGIRWDSDMKTRKGTWVSKYGKKKDLVPPNASQSPRRRMERQLSAKSGKSKDKRRSSHLKSTNNVRKTEPKLPIHEEVPEKTLYVIETKPEDSTTGLAQNGNDNAYSYESFSPSSKDKNERSQSRVRNPLSPPSPENEILRHSGNGIFTGRLSPSSSFSFPKKNLRRIEIGNHKALSPLSSPLSRSPYASELMPSDESARFHKGRGAKTESQTPNYSEETARSPRRLGKVITEVKVITPRKLNFRRGKVIDVQIKSGGSPKKLIFKQRRGHFGENQNGRGKTSPRSLKKVVATDEFNGSKPESVKVVLRRQQAAERKKGDQSLFNNVIEETASKLVKTRKSKVKALVGAFESLISLQDATSSDRTVQQY
ncbi:uncharacterized protein LOC127789635 [Diospyros lotus]|uniref:uncharacterized protein LOC127789635 n=1 Tax=Diospyros lotus TaxID=55363 RepID=UPI002252C6BA|nr:uncharacterized protein LOC127789635 [Diospyros lotus]